MLTLTASLLLGLTAAPGVATDSLRIQLAPDKGDAPLAWVALSETGEELGSGTTPDEVLQAVDGRAVIYCTARGSAWLALDVRHPNGSTRIKASATCTKVVADAKGRLTTTGVADPRRRS